MQCTNPISTAGDIWPCGQCIPCRINKRREWTGRILLEAKFTPIPSCFITLTYAEGFEPRTKDGSETTLAKSDLQKFLKRFRHENGEFRYFACGEYGERSTQRPHFHAILFGIPATPGWERKLQYAWSVPIEQSNGNHKHSFKYKGKTRALIGWVSVSEVTPERAAYVAGYVVKKMTKRRVTPFKLRDAKERDLYFVKRVGRKKNSLVTIAKPISETLYHKMKQYDERFRGRDPEFAIMSNKPGIGHNALRWLEDQHMTPAGAKAMLRYSDIMPEFRFGGKVYPIGKYLKDKLRERLNVPLLKADRHALYGPPQQKVDWGQFINDEFELANVKTPGQNIEAQIQIANIPETERKLVKDFRQQSKIRNYQRI